MVKQKRIIISILVASVFLIMAISCLYNQNKAYADVGERQETATVNGGEEGEVTPRLFTSLTLSINGGDGKIWATVKNEFTLFPSTVYVIVELYSSTEYQESYSNMTLVAINSTLDLDMGDTLVAEYPTGGVQKYWQARMRYRIDNDSWKSKDTGTYLYSAEGEFLDIL